jgi:hypothetical protein
MVQTAPTRPLPTSSCTVQVQIFGESRLTDAASGLMAQSPRLSADTAPWLCLVPGHGLEKP